MKSPTALVKASLDGQAMQTHPHSSMFFTGLFGAAGATLAGLIAYNSAAFHEVHNSLEGEEGYLSNLNFLGMNDPLVAVLIAAGSLMLMASAYHQYRAKPTYKKGGNGNTDEQETSFPEDHDVRLNKVYNFHTAAMVCIGLLAAYGLGVGFAALAGHRPDNLSDIGFDYDNKNDLSDSDQNKIGAYFIVFAVLAVGVAIAGWNRIVPTAKQTLLQMTGSAASSANRSRQNSDTTAPLLDTNDGADADLATSQKAGTFASTTN